MAIALSRVVAIGLFGLVAASCTSLADVSSGEIGCPPSEIVVTEKATTFSGTTWTAECSGRRYFCSAHGESGPSCTPASGPGTVTPGSAQPPPQRAGCEFDTQCKGERICVDAQCVDPPASTAPATPEPPASTPTPAPTPTPQ